MHGFQNFFSDFELWWLTIFMRVDLGERYIPQKKALEHNKSNQLWNCKKYCKGCLQMSFSKSDAFLVRWTWPSPEWGHA